MAHRPVKGLTLSQIAELPSCDVSLRELVAIVEAAGVVPVNEGERTRHHRAPRRYSLPSVERAIRRAKAGDLAVRAEDA